MQTSFLSRISKDDAPEARPMSLNLESEGDARIKKTYEFWRGTNAFFLSGKVMLGPRDETLMAKLFMLLVGLFSFVFYFVLLPAVGRHYHALLMTSFTACLVVFVMFYILTAIVEPGYLPHQNLLRVPETLNLNSEANRGLAQFLAGTLDYAFAGVNNIAPKGSKKANDMVSGGNRAEGVQPSKTNTAPTTSAVTKNGTPYGLAAGTDVVPPSLATGHPVEQPRVAYTAKYCVYCKIYRPERAFHCSKCNTCVRVFDHHCSLANNCVGKRNYRFFIGLVISGLSLNAVFAAGLILFYASSASLNGAAYRFFLLIMGMHCLFVLCFCMFHVFLCVVAGKTTKEFMNEVRAVNRSAENWDLLGWSEPLVNFGQLVPGDKANWLIDTY